MLHARHPLLRPANCQTAIQVLSMCMFVKSGKAFKFSPKYAVVYSSAKKGCAGCYGDAGGVGQIGRLGKLFSLTPL